MRPLYIIPLLYFLALPVGAQTYTTDFSSGLDGWIAEWADYPVGEETFYELSSAWSPLPAPLNQSNHSMMISGNNHSDDLFMYIRKQLSGLLPNTTYKVQFEVEFASNAATDAFGVGGPPGTSVYMKAGAVPNAPGRTVDDIQHYRMDIDKGNQAMDGADMTNIGHVGVGPGVTEYTLISRDNTGDVFTVTTDANGKVWVIIGTDSGFEATTTLYYNSIGITFYDPVPVELTAFSAVRESEGIALNWATERETNNFGFEVQRRTTGIWEKLSFVPGHGTSSLRNEYRYTDTDYPADFPGAGTVQYRLKQTDFDGTHEFSPIVEVELGVAPTTPGIAGPWPNPVNGRLNATIQLPEAATVTVTLHNAAGQQVRTLMNAQSLTAGSHALTTGTGSLPNGNYLLVLDAGDTVVSRTVVIHH